MRNQNKFKQRSMKCWKYELPRCDWFRFSSHWFEDGVNFSDQSETKQRNTAKREHKRSNVPLPALAFLQTGLVPLSIF